MKNLFFFFSLILILQSCETNPYPEQGGEFVNGKQPTQRPIAPAYTIDVKSTLKFKEGIEDKFRIKFFVPTGNAVINFIGLPDGMYFDKKESKLIWKPSFQAANDAKDPAIDLQRFPIKVALYSDNDTQAIKTKEIVIEVSDTARLFKTKTNVSTQQVTEGTEHNNSFEFINEDFPNGPFTVITRNLPQSLEVTLDKGNKATVNFKAAQNFVTVDDICTYYSCKRKFANGTIIITAPNGRSLNIPYDLTVNDDRFEPVFVNPTTINQGLDVSFVVTAYDPNGEVLPSITLENLPRNGLVTFENISGTKSDLLQTHMKLTWKDIPMSRRGTSTNFKFKSCVYNERRYMTECSNQTVTVNIEEQTHNAPSIQRDNWPLGKIEYLKFDKSFSVNIDVSDGDITPLAAPNVTIEPEAMKKSISFNNGTLKIRSSKPGLQQFSIRATSDYGIESVESFVFEILPESWSENIALISNVREIENVKNKDMFDSLDFVNPDTQNLEGRALSHRKTLVLGTDVLKNEDLLTKIETLSVNIRNIVVMSPLIDKLTNELGTEISELGILKLGRFNLQVNNPLSDFNFLLGRDIELTRPKWKMKLAGTLTAESHNPLLLKKKITSSCIEVLSLGNETTGMDYLTTAKCTRSNGGYLLLSSFEFADFATNVDDQDIPKNWLNTLTE
jgi:hypothetical protein